MEHVPIPFPAQALRDFLSAVSSATSADALLPALASHAALHNPEALGWLQHGAPSLREALRHHPGFFAPGAGLLHAIVALAAPLHEHFPRGLPLLLAAPAALALPRPAAACLLACMFLCALPRPHAECNQSCYAMLFGLPSDSGAVQKLLCALHYFERAAAAPPRGTLALERVAPPAALVAGGPAALHAHLAACAAPLLPLHVRREGSIHDARGALQADFANRYIGGGTLGGGCVQEEVLFSVAPECIVAQLLVPALAAHEAVLLAGVERFSAHAGYAHSFRFAGPLLEDCARVAEGEACGALAPGSVKAALVAFDALAFPHRAPPAAQLAPEHVLRELGKCAAAFGVGQAPGWPAELGLPAGAAPPIATGHWGCGAFNGARVAVRARARARPLSLRATPPPPPHLTRTGTLVRLSPRRPQAPQGCHSVAGGLGSGAAAALLLLWGRGRGGAAAGCAGRDLWRSSAAGVDSSSSSSSSSATSDGDCGAAVQCAVRVPLAGRGRAATH